MIGSLVVLFSSNLFFGPSPLSFQFWIEHLRPAPFKTQNFHYSTYRVTPRHRKALELISDIPNSAIVSTQRWLLPLLARPNGSLIYPRRAALNETVQADYVLLDKTNNGISGISSAFVPPEGFLLIESDPARWQLLRSDDSYLLFKRRQSPHSRELFPPFGTAVIGEIPE